MEETKLTTKLDIKNLNVFFSKKQILENISYRVIKNKITVILGQSGCGKSTLLQSINKITEENAGKILGDIRIDEEELFKKTTEEIRKKIGLVFQEPIVFPCSIEKNIIYPIEYHFKYSKVKQKELLIKYLKEVKLFDEVKDNLGMQASKLSGGQKQRLAIARSLSTEPEVLMLDEPCSALDIKNVLAIEELLTTIKNIYTILMVTHNLAQAKRIADYIIFMHNGKIIESNNAKDFFANPKEKLTKDYMNYADY